MPPETVRRLEQVAAELHQRARETERLGSELVRALGGTATKADDGMQQSLGQMQQSLRRAEQGLQSVTTRLRRP